MMGCFGRKRSDKNRDIINDDDEEVISNFDKCGVYCPDNKNLCRKHDLLVHSYNIFDYNTLTWSNMVENTYWNGYNYYSVVMYV